MARIGVSETPEDARIFTRAERAAIRSGRRAIIQEGSKAQSSARPIIQMGAREIPEVSPRLSLMSRRTLGGILESSETAAKIMRGIL